MRHLRNCCPLYYKKTLSTISKTIYNHQPDFDYPIANLTNQLSIWLLDTIPELQQPFPENKFKIRSLFTNIKPIKPSIRACDLVFSEAAIFKSKSSLLPPTCPWSQVERLNVFQVGRILIWVKTDKTKSIRFLSFFFAWNKNWNKLVRCINSDSSRRLVYFLSNSRR